MFGPQFLLLLGLAACAVIANTDAAVINDIEIGVDPVDGLSDPLPTPAGIANFLGIGYNIIDGNPEGGDTYLGGVDPGLLVTRRILKLTYDTNNLTPDLDYIVPDQVTFTPRESCAASEVRQTFYGTETYTEKISVDIDQSAKARVLFTKYKFSSSAQYKEVQRGVENNRYVYYEDKNVCNRGQARYQNELALYEQYPLEIGFVASACKLPLVYDEASYMQFLEDWGTHVVLRVDLGEKSTSRYAETRENFVQYARSNVDGSVKFKTNVIFGYRGALEVEVDTFERNFHKGQSFGSNLYNFTSGGPDLPEPIATYLIGMHEVFDRDYWQNSGEYVKTRLCTVDWVTARDQVQLNVETALNNYAEWRGSEESSDPLLAIPISWPKGTYGLQKPTTGCPNSHFTWAEGQRFQDTENFYGNNDWSSPLHFYGPYADNDVTQSFCMKTIDEKDIFNWSFEPGMYCVLKKGNCPYGMNQGSINWDEENSGTWNWYDGEMPDGDYWLDTKIYYCCQNDGFATNPIYLPVDEPFYLLKMNHQCQEVHGMTYTHEWFIWDTESYANEATGTHPYEGLIKRGTLEDVKLEYCYYEPIPDEEL